MVGIHKLKSLDPHNLATQVDALGRPRRPLAKQELCKACRGERFIVETWIAYFAVWPCTACRGEGTVRTEYQP